MDERKQERDEMQEAQERARNDPRVRSGDAAAGPERRAAGDVPEPYDVAAPGTAKEKVIRKGEHEHPGPTRPMPDRSAEDETNDAPRGDPRTGGRSA